MFSVMVFWLSQAFTFFAYGILIIVTMMSFNPQFLQLRDKPSLLSVKDTSSLCFSTQDEIVVIESHMFSRKQ